MAATSEILRQTILVQKARSGAEHSPVSMRMLGAGAAVSEGVVIVLCALASACAYRALALGTLSSLQDYLGFGILYALLFIERSYARGFYRFERLVARPLGVTEILRIWVIVAGLFLLIAYLGKFGGDLSRGVFVIFALTTPASLFLTRAAVHKASRRAVERGIVHQKRVLLVGEPREVYNRVLLNRLSASGYRVAEIVSMQFDDVSDGFCPDRIVERVRRDPVDEILVCASWSRLRQVGDVMTRLRVLPLPVLVVADQRVRDLLSNPITRVGSVLAVEIQRGPLSVGEQALKRVFDVALAALALAVLMPLLVLVGLLISIDSPGPVLFRQMRVGFSGRGFKIYKFRSMTVLDDGAVIRQATRNDKRVTRVGSFLRRTSIDELPQLLNVLRGEMSLVGPRPHASAHDNEYSRIIAKYAFRHHMKPGITGWAQVNGCRGETSTVEMMQRRVDCDLWYVNNWSPWLDFKTIVMTVVQIWKHDAY